MTLRRMALAGLAVGSLLVAACGGDDESGSNEPGGEATGAAPQDAAPAASGPPACTLLTEAEVDQAISAAGLDLDVGACRAGSTPEEAYWPADHGLGVRVTIEEFASDAEALAAYEEADIFDGATTKDADGFRHNQLGDGISETRIVHTDTAAFSDAVEAGDNQAKTDEATLALLALLFERLG